MARLVLWLAVLAAAAAERPKEILRVPMWPESTGPDGGRPAAADLSAKVGGAPARIVRLLGPDDELMLILVLDLTEDLSLAQLAKEALAAELHALPARVYVGLLRAQDGLRVLADPTARREPVMEAIRGLPVSGKAGLLESLPAALRLADSILAKAAVRVALLYVTDSSIYNYRDDYINPVINWSDQHDLSRRFPEGLVKEKIARLERQAAAYQTPLFIVHLNYRSDRLNEAYQTGLMQLAAALGGGSQFCRSRQEIAEAVAGAMRRVVRLHRVDVELPDRRVRSVQLELESKAGPLVYRNRFALEPR